MDAATFVSSLLDAAADLSFVEDVDLRTEAFVVKGRIRLTKERFLQIYFNEQTNTTAFALIEEDARIWGIDHDALRGWHLHPVGQPNTHRDIDPLAVEEVMRALQEAWQELP